MQTNSTVASNFVVFLCQVLLLGWLWPLSRFLIVQVIKVFHHDPVDLFGSSPCHLVSWWRTLGLWVVSSWSLVLCLVMPPDVPEDPAALDNISYGDKASSGSYCIHSCLRGGNISTAALERFAKVLTQDFYQPILFKRELILTLTYSQFRVPYSSFPRWKEAGEPRENTRKTKNSILKGFWPSCCEVDLRKWSFAVLLWSISFFCVSLLQICALNAR